MSYKVSYSLLGGAISSVGSVFGKLASFVKLQSDEGYDDVLNKLIPVVFLILMVFCNIVGWMLFTRAMHQLNSSLIATLISATSNYAFSGIFGWLLFYESLSTLWCVGLLLVCLGLILITTDYEEDSHKVIKEHVT